VWRGEHAVVINKPANLLVQPDVKGGDSVVTRIWGMFGVGGPGFSPAAVHRLDRNTTGALVVALSGEALRGLERLFKERLVTKRYLAVVVGALPEKGFIDAPLLKEELTVRVGEGKTAQTRYRRLSTDGQFSLASLELLTGRTHQARVHMAHIGCPILGDRKYGNIEINRRHRAEARRPLLHAYELGFPGGWELPETLLELRGKTFRAELPQDMAALLNERGWSGQVQ
jgi:23S rRNA pseudouridine955/2504/2580 synthase